MAVDYEIDLRASPCANSENTGERILFMASGRLHLRFLEKVTFHSKSSTYNRVSVDLAVPAHDFYQ